MKYTCIKRVERIQKKFASCFKEDPSTAPPNHYGYRFRDFCTKIIETGKNGKELKGWYAKEQQKQNSLNLQMQNRQNLQMQNR